MHQIECYQLANSELCTNRVLQASFIWTRYLVYSTSLLGFPPSYFWPGPTMRYLRRILHMHHLHFKLMYLPIKYIFIASNLISFHNFFTFFILKICKIIQSFSKLEIVISNITNFMHWNNQFHMLNMSCISENWPFHIFGIINFRNKNNQFHMFEITHFPYLKKDISIIS